MLAYFGTDVDGGKCTVGVNVDGMEGIGTEGGDKEWRYSMVEVLGLGDGVEELAINKFLQGKPNVAALLVVDGILILLQYTEWSGQTFSGQVHVGWAHC